MPRGLSSVPAPFINWDNDKIGGQLNCFAGCLRAPAAFVPVRGEPAGGICDSSTRSGTAGPVPVPVPVPEPRASSERPAGAVLSQRGTVTAASTALGLDYEKPILLLSLGLGLSPITSEK